MAAAHAVGRRAVRVDAATPELVGAWDARRLERVVANLLENAVKYSPPSTEVLVRVAPDEGACGPGAVLVVADRGIGIPAADLPRVFERFFRAANAAGAAPGARPRVAG